MIAATLTALFMVVSFATLLTFADLWIRGHFAFKSLKRERALMKAGFVPMVEADEVRLRQPARFATSATRPFSHRLPARSPVPVLGAA